MPCLISLVAIFGLASLVPGALACMCDKRPTFQRAYCSQSTGYLIQAEVVAKSEPIVPDDMMPYMPDDELERYFFLENVGSYRYTLRVTDVYVLDGNKAPFPQSVQGFLRVGQDVTLEARLGGSVCGVNLELGKFYVLEGYVADKELGTGLCFYTAGYDSRQQLELPGCIDTARRSEAEATGEGLGMEAGRVGLLWDLVGDSERDARNAYAAKPKKMPPPSDTDGRSIEGLGMEAGRDGLLWDVVGDSERDARNAYAAKPKKMPPPSDTDGRSIEIPNPIEVARRGFWFHSVGESERGTRKAVDPKKILGVAQERSADNNAQRPMTLLDLFKQE